MDMDSYVSGSTPNHKYAEVLDELSCCVRPQAAQADNVWWAPLPKFKYAGALCNSSGEERFGIAE
jgi:hypothetical protein